MHATFSLSRTSAGRPIAAPARLAALLVLALSLALATVALAAAPAAANPKYAGFVLDANTGETLYADRADARRYPASLTKIMTTYIIFEELAAGRLRFGTRMRVSSYAAGRPPSKIGFRPGDTIKVRDAIKALVTKSANDVAVVVAEHIEGSESAFARRMTKTARRLGMTSTTFRNANGLPNSGQVTTARDMARLGLAIQKDFPQYYGVFQTRVFRYGSRRYPNHNRLLGRVEGVDGIKTGFIRASGFNLVTSVRRDGKHIIGVVMGGRTGVRRNAHMADLIARTLPKATVGKPLPLLAYNDADPPPVPLAKPPMTTLYAARFKANADEGDPIGDQILAFAAQTRGVAGSGDGGEGGPDTLRAVIAQAEEAGLPAPVPASADAVGSTRAGEAGGDVASAASQGSNRIADAFETLRQAPAVTVDSDALVAAITRARLDGRGGAARGERRAEAPRGQSGGGEGRDSATLSGAPRAEPPGLRQDAAMRGRGAWQIQLGAVGSRREAEALLSDAQRSLPSLEGVERVTAPVSTGRGTLYRARLAGFHTRNAADEACKRFANHDRPCWAVSM